MDRIKRHLKLVAVLLAAVVLLAIELGHEVNRANTSASLALLQEGIKSSRLPSGAKSAVVVKGDTVTTVSSTGKVISKYVPPESGVAITVKDPSAPAIWVKQSGTGFYPGLGFAIRDDGMFGVTLDSRLFYFNRFGFGPGLFVWQGGERAAAILVGTYTVGYWRLPNTSLLVAVDLKRRTLFGFRVRF